MIELTDIKIHIPELRSNRLCAYASIVINGDIAVHDLRVVDGNRGLIIAMPCRQNLMGKYFDLVHPVNAEVRDVIDRAVIRAYHLVREQG